MIDGYDCRYDQGGDGAMEFFYTWKDRAWYSTWKQGKKAKPSSDPLAEKVEAIENAR